MKRDCRCSLPALLCLAMHLVLGGSVALLGHFAGERTWLEWSGIGAMLATTWYERYSARELLVPAPNHASAPLVVETSGAATSLLGGGSRSDSAWIERPYR